MDLTSKATPKSDTKKATDLQRIRNNQRRSRARRKDYIAELEEKVRRYENSNSQTIGSPALKQLTKENELLKSLLHSLGLGPDFLQAYTKASDATQEISKASVQLDGDSCCPNKGSSPSSAQDNSTPLAVLGMQPTSPFPGENYTLDTQDTTQHLHQIQQNTTQTEQSLFSDFSFDFSKLPHGSSESAQNHQILSYSAQIAIQSVADRPTTDPSENSMPPDNTTLCSLAFSLIMNNNRKGCDVAEIDLRLRPGYRYGSAPSDGCRVDNKILFSVLADIL